MYYIHLTLYCLFFLIKIAAIKHLKEAHPKGRFWIKVDACDLKAALQESTRGIWNGDVDMVDGKVAALHKEYMDRKALMNGTIDQLLQNVAKMVDLLKEDIIFLAAGLEESEREYRKKFDSPSTPQQILMSLCWERVEYNTLLQQAQCFLATMVNLADRLNQIQPQTREVAKCIRSLKDDKHSICAIGMPRNANQRPHMFLFSWFQRKDEIESHMPFLCSTYPTSQLKINM